MDSEVRTTTEDDEAEVPLRRTSTRSRKDPEKAKFLHGVRATLCAISTSSTPLSCLSASLSSGRLTRDSSTLLTL